MTNDEQPGRGKQYSDEEVLASIRRVYRKHGKVTTDLYKAEDDTPALSVVIDRFADENEHQGGWLNAKEAAGVGGDGRRNNARPREYSNDDMVEMLRTCEDRYGNTHQSTFDDDEDFCSSSTVVQRFGKWSEAKRRAGVV